MELYGIAQNFLLPAIVLKRDVDDALDNNSQKLQAL
jgi:hypothetical protein